MNVEAKDLRFSLKRDSLFMQQEKGQNKKKETSHEC